MDTSKNRSRFTLFKDARDHQILCLTIFLGLGVAMRDWSLQPAIVATAILSTLVTQGLLSWLSSHKELTLHLEKFIHGFPFRRLPCTHISKKSSKSCITPLNPPFVRWEESFLPLTKGELEGVRQPQMLVASTYVYTVAFRRGTAREGFRPFAQDVETPTPSAPPLLKERTFNWRSPLITALGLSLLLRTDHIATMAFAAAIAIASKFLCKTNDKHFFNPANLGIIAALTLTNDAWVSPGQWGDEIWYAFIFIGAGGMVLKRVGRWDTTGMFLASYALLEAVRNLYLGWTWDVWSHRMMSGSLLLFALFMVTDPRSIPNARPARLIWALAIAVLTFVLRNQFYLSTAVFWALFLLAPLTIVLDKLWESPRFEWKKKDTLALTS
ncbi:MAG: RnfABCDGE type electron transport complex subunit D [Cyanobacteria bacterium P01_C01_bin.118]